jgi:Family of unknown function (DUF6364)
MKAKLTLSIDENVLAKARSKAKKQNRTLSELIESYLSNDFSASNSKTPITDSLTGILKGKMPDKSYKELKAVMYKDKYGL